MYETIKKSFIGGIVFLGTIIIGFISFATYTALPTQENGDSLNKDIWNNLVNTINDIGTRTDGIYNSGGNIGIGTNNPGAKLEVSGNLKTSNSLSNAARPICYSVFTNGNANKALIMIPLNNNNDDLDARCHNDINSLRHAAGVAKSNLYSQNCVDIENLYYGGGYTSYVEESFFESNRTLFTNCNSTNAIICCSLQFPN